MNLRRLPLRGVLNLRDLGGYPVGDSKATKWRTIFRADGLFGLEKDEIDRIADYCGVGMVIDLRGSRELALRSNAFAEHKEIKFVSVPLISEDRDIKDIEYEWQKLETAYVGIIEHSKRQIKEIFENIGECLPLPVLYNCTAGKDRTGIVSSLILSVCGVDSFDIVSDYEVSSTYIRRDLEKVTEPGKALNMEHVSSPASAMRHMLNYVDDNYGSVAKYLNHCGIRDEFINNIKSTFLVELGG